MAVLSVVPGGEAFLCPTAVNVVAPGRGSLTAAMGQRQQQRPATRWEEREGHTASTYCLWVHVGCSLAHLRHDAMLS